MFKINMCVPEYSSIKTIKHSLLIMIFCKTSFKQSYTTVRGVSVV